MLDLDRLIADCRDALTQDHAEAMIRDLVARAVAERSAAEVGAGAPPAGAGSSRSITRRS